MTYRLSQQDINDALIEQVRNCHLAIHNVASNKDSNVHKNLISLPQRFGRGSFELASLSGITFSSLSLKFNQNVTMLNESLDSGFFIGFNFGDPINYDFYNKSKYCKN